MPVAWLITINFQSTYHELKLSGMKILKINKILEKDHQTLIHHKCKGVHSTRNLQFTETMFRLNSGIRIHADSRNTKIFVQRTD